MSCCGKHKEKVATGSPDVERKTLPSDECILCAEKHLATAYALSVENGYESVNRAAVIGQLCLCQWHCWHADMELAQSIRDIRHLVQQRREAEIVWEAALKRMDEIANFTLKKDGDMI